MGEDVTSAQPHPPPEPDHGARVVLLVPRAHVKATKLVLEKHKLFDRRYGITPDENDDLTKRMRVHTTIPCSETEKQGVTSLKITQHLKGLGLDDISPDITHTSFHAVPSPVPIHNPLRKALLSALTSLPPSTLNTLPSIESLTSNFPDAYSIHQPLLLVPSASLTPLWRSLLATHPTVLEQVWRHIAFELDCTHMALNSPIPPSNAASSAHARDAENILRSPVNLAPLYGDFGPPPTQRTLREPGEEDFSKALWVQACQNGVHQTWAPVYTMFSRGNVKEKARILALPSLPRNAAPATLSSVSANAEEQGEGITAVDFYAGIGYFALPYRLAGASLVLCWEINPWSIEGLRRGCELNKQRYRIFTPADIPAPDATEEAWIAWRADVQQQQQQQQQQEHQQGKRKGKSKSKAKEDNSELWIFTMSNSTAPSILHFLRPLVPPIRHVNLGLLPLSRLSWPAAVGAIDSQRGGWVHAHENVGEEELEARREEVEGEFRRLAGRADGTAIGRGEGVRVEHVERVKLYAPGVVHVVFDVYIPGTTADDVE
ncbi:tRNA wybutosine-synthesizing protein [Stagonosporopsis vannaccii]|nr:tRNA wybutosine-synthesizing protein [Stagonosporopsis vannaccii]